MPSDIQVDKDNVQQRQLQQYVRIQWHPDFLIEYSSRLAMATLSKDAAPSYGLATRDKSVPWYKADIGEIPKPARELLEKYSGIASDRVVPHVYEVVSQDS